MQDYNAYEIPFVTIAAKIIGVISAGAVLLATTSCGGGSNSGSGGGSNSGSGGNGGGSGNGPQITVISPSMVMSDIAIGAFTIIGSGFTQASQVLIDGKPPAFPILLEDSEDIEVYLLGAPALGVYQITVTNGSQVSNSSPFTYYYPAPAPAGLFQAFPGYYAEPSFLINQAVVADFNGDGRADVMVNSSAMGGNYPTMALLLGQSDGSLATPQYVSNVVGNVAGDVDGNGTIDLVGLLAGTDGGEQCSVYLNDGHANFTPGPSCPAIPVFPDISTALIDVNGDGLPDLVVAGQYSPIVVLLNQGGGNFGQPIMTGVSTGNDWKIIVADFSGNGLPDIAYNIAVATGVEQVHLLLNQGNGVFKDTIPSSLQGVGGVLTAGDFNLDGIQDLIVQTVTTSQTINLQVFLGQGRNAFTLASTITLDPIPLATYQFAVGDFDHDGLPDLVGTNGTTQPSYLFFLWGNGQGQFTPEVRNGPAGFTVALGDINGDGLPDIVVPDAFNVVSVGLGRTDRNYYSPPLLIPAEGPYVSIADVNGDGLPDLLIGGSVVINQGNSSFAAPVALSSSQNAYAIADLNGDGLADLIGEQEQNIQIWPGTGNPSFPGSPIVYTPPIAIRSDLQVADVDHDGYPDLLIAGIILYSDGHFGFTPVEVPFTAPFVIGDFNGDGYTDIATNGQTWLGGPNRTFTLMANSLGLPDGVYTAVGDLGNGALDLVTTDGTVWYGNGKGDFYQQGGFTADGPMGGIVLGDFNHDGLLDVAVGLQFPQQIAVFINDGKGGFERSFYASGAATFGMASADFNGDGKIDLVVCNYVTLTAPPNALVIFGN